MPYKSDTCCYPSRRFAKLKKYWLVQYQDNWSEWDIGSWYRRLYLLVREYYKSAPKNMQSQISANSDMTIIVDMAWNPNKHTHQTLYNIRSSPLSHQVATLTTNHAYHKGSELCSIRVAEWVEHPPPVLRDWGIRRSWVLMQTLHFLNPGWVNPMTLKLILVSS